MYLLVKYPFAPSECNSFVQATQCGSHRCFQINYPESPLLPLPPPPRYLLPPSLYCTTYIPSPSQHFPGEFPRSQASLVDHCNNLQATRQPTPQSLQSPQSSLLSPN